MFQKTGWLFTLCFIAAVLLPRLAQEGMFVDGTTYAAIARNWATGKGTFWQPFFSSSFWLPYVRTDAFYEHPPLHFALQGMFFKVLGDTIWVERLYCALVVLLQCFIISKIWQLFFKEDTEKRTMTWLPILFFYLIPIAMWGMATNMLEGTMGIFTLAAVWLAVLYKENYAGVLLAGGCIVAAFLTKGLVGLFPLVVPSVLWMLNPSKKSFQLYFLQGLLLFFVVMIAAIGFYFYPPSHHFFNIYFQQQVVKALSGGRETAPTGHFYLIPKLFTEAIPLIIVSLGCCWYARKRKVALPSTFSVKFCLSIFFCAYLPLLISVKQSPFYVIPAMPFLALAYAAWLSPVFLSFKEILEEKYLPFLRSSTQYLTILLVGILIYSIALIGKTRAGEGLIDDLKRFRTVIPHGAKITACRELIEDSALLAYAQRYFEWELQLNATSEWVLMKKGVCEPENPTQTPVLKEGELLLYKR
jgi:hypothetical protein